MIDIEEFFESFKEDKSSSNTSIGVDDFPIPINKTESEVFPLSVSSHLNKVINDAIPISDLNSSFHTSAQSHVENVSYDCRHNSLIQPSLSDSSQEQSKSNLQTDIFTSNFLSAVKLRLVDFL